MGAVWREGDRIRVRLPKQQQVLLAQLPELLGTVAADADDPATERMYPNAYPHDEAAAWEFNRMVDGELETARHRDQMTFAGSLERAMGPGLPVAEAEAWLRVIGDARLVLASREGIGRDDELPDPSLSNPRLAVVHYLGALQHEIVEALMTSMVDT